MDLVVLQIGRLNAVAKFDMQPVLARALSGRTCPRPDQAWERSTGAAAPVCAISLKTARLAESVYSRTAPSFRPQGGGKFCQPRDRTWCAVPRRAALRDVVGRLVRTTHGDVAISEFTGGLAPDRMAGTCSFADQASLTSAAACPSLSPLSRKATSARV